MLFVSDSNCFQYTHCIAVCEALAVGPPQKCVRQGISDSCQSFPLPVLFLVFSETNQDLRRNYLSEFFAMTHRDMSNLYVQALFQCHRRQNGSGFEPFGALQMNGRARWAATSRSWAITRAMLRCKRRAHQTSMRKTLLFLTFGQGQSWF